MGFFSWKTQDTNKSVISKWVEHTPLVPHTRKAFLIDHQGNSWGSTYDGYGCFGKDEKDFYELLAEMNGITIDDVKDREELRNIGHRLSCGINAIIHKETGEIYKANGIDFRNWGDDKLENGMSANDLLDSGEWNQFTIKEENILYPNIVENLDGWDYKNVEPKDCEFQGFFL